MNCWLLHMYNAMLWDCTWNEGPAERSLESGRPCSSQQVHVADTAAGAAAKGSKVRLVKPRLVFTSISFSFALPVW